MFLAYHRSVGDQLLLLPLRQFIVRKFHYNLPPREIFTLRNPLPLSQILHSICDMNEVKSTAGDTPKRILQRIYGHGRGWVFIPKDFLDIGTDTAIRQSLSRLSRQRTIRRLMHGIYDYPFLVLY